MWVIHMGKNWNVDHHVDLGTPEAKQIHSEPYGAEPEKSRLERTVIENIMEMGLVNLHKLSGHSQLSSNLRKVYL